jgi:hypothetical protein
MIKINIPEPTRAMYFISRQEKWKLFSWDPYFRFSNLKLGKD